MKKGDDKQLELLTLQFLKENKKDTLNDYPFHSPKQTRTRNYKETTFSNLTAREIMKMKNYVELEDKPE